MRSRLRELGISIGRHPTGPNNAITDVPGVAVGHTTIIGDAQRVARTGVTVVLPRTGEHSTDLCYGGIYSFNGNGEMTGSHWLEESGLIGGPIGITNTHQVGVVRDALVEHELRHDDGGAWCLPIVAETYDGFLNDIRAFHVVKDDVFAALAAASTGKVAEGNVGGGTGMICHEFKGGIGTSSRVVGTGAGTYTVGVLVQANYGERRLLRLDGHPIGAILHTDIVAPPSDPSIKEGGSIIIIIATDAPLLADQCKRLARRATVGLAQVGGTGNNSSGDIFLAFSTGNRITADATEPIAVTTIPLERITPLFHATADAVQEAIWNALCAAETMTGHLGRTVQAIPLDLLVDAYHSGHSAESGLAVGEVDG